MTPLRATARLQLHAGFGFDAAAAQVDYYAALGVSHLYLSPVGTAVPGSTHGYDQTDPTRLNPELGGDDGFARLVRAARAAGLGLLLDIVPNHMAAHADNPWWWDVLAQGRASRHADWFDIDWRAPGREGRLWLPVLDRPLRAAIADGVLRVEDGARGPVLVHHDVPFPASGTPQEDRAAWCAACNADPAWLEALVLAQPYRLAWWRIGFDRVNYRRFFDITSLAALRIERAPVFDAVHALPLRLLAEGAIDGVRIDHIDGLADPRGYLRRLRRALDAAGTGPERPVLLVEKILAPGETLPADWTCDGTTGYDFMDQAAGVLHAGEGEAPLRAQWRAASGRSGDFAAEERLARAQQLVHALAAETDRAGRALDALVAGDAALRELGAPALRRALVAVLCEFPVYRTYAQRDGFDPDDLARWQAAAQRARRRDDDPVLAAAIDALLEALQRPGATARTLRLRCEQLSAPLNAKSVEDTAFYRHGVLLSRNEVGSHPQHLALPVEDFHAAAARRGPRALLATSTHDHKRGADVRARLALLSAEPTWWADVVSGVETAVGEACAQVDGGDRAMLWQTLVGAWPPALRADDAAGVEALRTRVAGWQVKALREAKLRTAWTRPDERYEAAAAALLDRALADAAARAALARAAETLAAPGAVVGLVQAALQLCAPGVPDLYQGCEGWDLSLVDPDNRRPVDFARRRAWLADDAPPGADWRDGRPKALLWRCLLALRRARPALFAHGDYAPLYAEGAASDRMLGFTRRHDGDALIVLLPRAFGSSWIEGDAPALVPRFWDATSVALPDGRWRDVTAGTVVAGGRHPLPALWSRFPLAVLAAER
ncbi:malto-oligosyltrehalose synthase [Luteimonas sp. FCS-9]|uniref:malto-oligosyltrehalose synthase n=1 Tax=Luteimonas sp. FCS-9 TaxID=1547516 RepID=UPI00063EA121|nr:malto-oligosyltrehalose synthase [Luteimonas sp. FCS-9]KLI99441.1 malto-oligosyltrehalose synthase [Luteimonas sp. FCS-9]